MMTSSLTRWAPLADLAELRGRLDRVFDDIGLAEGREWTPRVDVVHDERGLLIRADVPGVKPDDIEVSIAEGVLTIAGRHEESKEETREDYLRRERRIGSFSRSLALPAGVDPKAIEAECSDGVLEVRVPVPEPAKPETVEIKPKADG